MKALAPLMLAALAALPLAAQVPSGKIYAKKLVDETLDPLPDLRLVGAGTVIELRHRCGLLPVLRMTGSAAPPKTKARALGAVPSWERHERGTARDPGANRFQAVCLRLDVVRRVVQSTTHELGKAVPPCRGALAAGAGAGHNSCPRAARRAAMPRAV